MFKCRYLPFKHTIFENRKFTSKNHSKNVRLKKPTKRKQNQLINKKRKTIITINVNSPDSFIIQIIISICSESGECKVYVISRGEMAKSSCWGREMGGGKNTIKQCTRVTPELILKDE